MNNVLIDSDVILDFFFDRKPYSNYSSTILSQCELKRINGFVTPVIISNIYFLLRKRSTHQRVVNKLNQLLTFLDILIIDKQIVLNALNSSFKDFEDALQNYAAEYSKNIDLIITRNLKDYKKSNLSVMTPEMYCKLKLNNT